MLNLGIIGTSEGNGHPYSWSAIFNGYNPEEMKDCPFPAIPKYLSEHNFPESSIQEGSVTHIWTQDKEVSDHIAKSSNIETVLINLPDMVSEVDAVLLARDDAETHLRLAEPFLKAGIPIYIDKPLATLRSEAESIYSLEKYEGQIFTCSALRFANEFILNENDWKSIGKLRSIEAHVSGPWNTYAIHIIEPVLNILGDGYVLHSAEAKHNGNQVELSVEWDNQARGKFTADPDSNHPISIRIFGELGEKKMVFNDSFGAFRSALLEFVAICKNRKDNHSKDITLRCVDLIEQGL